MAKSMYYSSWGPEFSFQHPHQHSELPVTSTPEYTMPSSGPCRYCTHIHTYRYTWIHKFKKKIFFLALTQELSFFHQTLTEYLIWALWESHILCDDTAMNGSWTFEQKDLGKLTVSSRQNPIYLFQMYTLCIVKNKWNDYSRFSNKSYLFPSLSSFIHV